MAIIKGWRAIAQTFGVTQAVVRSWREQGAPILLLPGGEKETVPAANVPELWAWLSGRYGPAASPSPSPAKKEALSLPDPSLTAASEPPVPAHQSAATPPQTCPNCGTTGMVLPGACPRSAGKRHSSPCSPPALGFHRVRHVSSSVVAIRGKASSPLAIASLSCKRLKQRVIP